MLNGTDEIPVWTEIECPDESDFLYMTENAGIPHEFIESAMDMDERPRIELNDEWRLTILRIPVVSSDDDSIPFNTVPLGIVTNGRTIFTICAHHTDMMGDFIAQSRRKNVCITSYPDFLLTLLCESTYWFQRYLKIINDDVMHAEKGLEKSVRNAMLIRMMKLQQTLVYFNTALRGNSTLTGRIERLYEGQYDPDLAEDAEIELTQADNTVNVYMEILTGTMDSFASIISNNVNGIMKRMTAISIILMVPTLIASFYGMNVNMSIAGYQPSFWIIVGASLTLTALIYMILRRSNWF